eukprot:6491352-Amphidinium_carterae.2
MLHIAVHFQLHSTVYYDAEFAPLTAVSRPLTTSQNTYTVYLPQLLHCLLPLPHQHFTSVRTERSRLFCLQQLHRVVSYVGPA